jgi:hypothetical protein
MDAVCAPLDSRSEVGGWGSADAFVAPAAGREFDVAAAVGADRGTDAAAALGAVPAGRARCTTAAAGICPIAPAEPASRSLSSDGGFDSVTVTSPRSQIA